ncbi:hypothetical protein [Photobacterium carnosum]|uniref:hypothetical protein n=1 Tax=Photobacterium carnosum TaxID=2023717 RepID=UPI001E4930ED|nr:hypothetical protein [Photobacterium carnosum]MCD9513838.1 hypothetical protein [Photobacterium carnosum]MCD9521263.1 hypothetical protein [Photobacterium carnosum]
MNKIISVFLVLLAFSGWITGGVLIYGVNMNRDYATKMAGENAFNIIEQSLHNDHSEAVILANIELWKQDGWTAQIGSIITLCQSDPQRFQPWISAKNIPQICKEAK